MRVEDEERVLAAVKMTQFYGKGFDDLTAKF